MFVSQGLTKERRTFVKKRIEVADLEARIYDMIEEHQSIMDRGYITEETHDAHTLAVKHLEEIQEIIQSEVG
jgi:hypothetical protein